MKYVTRSGEKEFQIHIEENGSISLNGISITCEPVESTADLQVIAPAGVAHRAFVERESGGSRVVYVNNYRLQVEVQRQTAHSASQILRSHSAGRSAATQRVSAPMPGLVRSVFVQPGDTVAAGTVLMILEAMKMENEVRSTAAGVVTQISVQPSENVEKGRVLAIVTLKQ